MAVLNEIGQRPIGELTPYANNARTHSRKQIRKIAKSIERFGFLNPVLVDGKGTILCGHGRLEAAKLLGLSTVPTVSVEHLSEAEQRAYILADNRIADEGGWDREKLAQELEFLVDLDFEVELTGFDVPEIDIIIGEEEEIRGKGPDPEDQIPEIGSGPAITRQGDLWLLGPHRLFCGDAREAASFEVLMAGEVARLIFTDPPYNVPVAGHVSGLGQVKHREFAMASGEMSEAGFTAFLGDVLRQLAAASIDGSLHMICMDWRHLAELFAAGRDAYDELKNLCVWNKTNGGMGSLYRSKHELVCIFKKGSAPHINNVELGATGRYRTNVWDYPGVNTFRAGRMDELQMHPTVKPVALVADAIRDVSKRGEIVLDAFCGSGTTLIAAHKTGRRGYGIEIDPVYCDTIIRRFEKLTGKRATLAATGEAFEEVSELRLAEAVDPSGGELQVGSPESSQPGAEQDPAVPIRTEPRKRAGRSKSALSRAA